MAAAAAVFSNCALALPALADGTEDVYQNSIVPGANDAIKSVMSQPTPTPQPRPQASSDNGSIAQVPPVQQHRIGPEMKLPGN
ncbi:MAG TPA: hypothetical protein VIW73_13935, partial [Candidatus Cybelea sp.]